VNASADLAPVVNDVPGFVEGGPPGETTASDGDVAPTRLGRLGGARVHRQQER
jgi:hypothetical protein